MKNKKWMAGIIVVGLVLFGIGCGGGSSSPTADGNADNANDGVVVAELPTPTPTPVPGGENGDNGQTQENGPVIQPNVAPDLDSDGIPNEEDPDADGDTYFADTDDCNDLDASINPDAPDKPEHPTYIDSNCDGVDGNADNAIWVSFSEGDDLGPGTIDLPVRTIPQAVVLAAMGPEAPADVYIVGGDYSDGAFFQDGIGLYGGFGPLDENSRRERDISAYLTKIKYTTTPIVVHSPAIGSQNTVIEGLEINGMPDIPALILSNSSPIIRYNTIRAMDSSWNSHAVDIYTFMPWPPDTAAVSRPYFFRNTIEAGDCSQGLSTSVAVYSLASGHNALLELSLEENTITSGLANVASVGVYAMADMQGVAYLTAQENTITAGEGGAQTAGIMLGRPLFEDMPANMHITGADIFKNRIYGGGNALASYGVVVEKAQELIKLTNNFITGGRGAIADAVGVSLKRTAADIKHNTINAGSSLANATAILLLKKTITHVENNILTAEDGPVLYGIFEKDAASTPESLVANLFDLNLGVKYHDFTFGDIVNIATLNVLPDIAVDSDNISGTAGFADVSANDYHLTDASDALDAAAESNVAEDIDGSTREMPDIGADEFIEVQ